MNEFFFLILAAENFPYMQKSTENEKKRGRKTQKSFLESILSQIVIKFSRYFPVKSFRKKVKK